MLLAAAVLAMGSMILEHPATTAPLSFRLAPEGDVLAWLVAGPYPGPGLTTDYLSGEAAANPAEGQQWRLAIGDVGHGLDLKAFFRTDNPGLAYCYTQLDSPKAQTAELLFGSDDGAKLFLNGENLYEKDVKRGVRRDDERVAIHLNKGLNRLLFKIEQYDGGWGLMARISGAHGVTQRLQVAPGGSEGFRSFAGKGGSFDLAGWQSYRSLRATAQTFLDRMGPKAVDPERLRAALAAAPSTLPTGDADHASQTIAGATQQVGSAYDRARSKLLRWAQNPGPLTKSETAREDFVRVMPGGRYFVHADGKPFIPMSCNHNTDWPDLEESNPLNHRYDPAKTERWFAKLRDNGVNVVRIMVETPQSGNLEEKVGTFRPEQVIWLDNIFRAARKSGVKLWITPYDTFWMNLHADDCPYWRPNGGPIDRSVDFLTKPEVIDAQRRRMRFLIDRYGNSGTVFAWEIMNEIDLWWGASPEQIRSWTRDMSAYVRSYEHRRWGRNHMLAVSFANPEPAGLNAETSFQSTGLDFATMHLYLGASRGPGPGQAEQAGIDFAGGVLYARSHLRDNRPVMDGESGPIDHWIADGRLDDEVFHQMSWQHLMAGGAGSGTRWPYRQPHEISNGMLRTLHAMSTFCDGVSWKLLIGPERPSPIHVSPGAELSGFSTATAGIAWIRLRKGSGSQDVSFTSAASDLSLTVKLFDVRGNAWIASKTAKGPVKMAVPEGIAEVAVCYELR